jgi:hypothetical protein
MSLSWERWPTGATACALGSSRSGLKSKKRKRIILRPAWRQLAMIALLHSRARDPLAIRKRGDSYAPPNAEQLWPLPGFDVDGAIASAEKPTNFTIEEPHRVWSARKQTCPQAWA